MTSRAGLLPFIPVPLSATDRNVEVDDAFAGRLSWCRQGTAGIWRLGNRRSSLGSDAVGTVKPCVLLIAYHVGRQTTCPQRTIGRCDCQPEGHLVKRVQSGHLPYLVQHSIVIAIGSDYCDTSPWLYRPKLARWRWGRVELRSTRSLAFAKCRRCRKIQSIAICSVRRSSYKLIGVGVKNGVKNGVTLTFSLLATPRDMRKSGG
jgi:hypothetical protein